MAADKGCTDLARFLQEVGTDAKEARYWKKHFQRSLEAGNTFAVMHIDDGVIHCPEMLAQLCSCLGFLLRHDMQMVLVHGRELSISDESADSKVNRSRLNKDTMLIVDALDKCLTAVRPLFGGNSIFTVVTEEIQGNNTNGYHTDNPVKQDCSSFVKSSSSQSCTITKVDVSSVRWALSSRHIAVVQSIGETLDGHLIEIDVRQAVDALACQLKPLKVMFINDHGGLLDENKQVITNINIPFDLDSKLSRPWCTAETKETIVYIAKLLEHLPAGSSVVISCASKLLSELFTHGGSGTFFKIMEKIFKHTSLSDINIDRLTDLIEKLEAFC